MRSRYNKPVIIAETAYPYTTANADSTANVVTGGCSGYAITPAGQQANFAAVQNTARNAGASGIFYWEPSWYNGRLNSAIRWLQ